MTTDRIEALTWEPANVEDKRLQQRQLKDLRQLIQDDLLTYFDGMSDRVLTEMCEIVVQRFKPHITSETK